MACKTKILCFVIVIGLNLLSLVHGKPKVPCYFIFGDSLVDNGNNNLLDTQAKGNYQPYGIDFPKGPTGRFTNGLNIADFIAEFLGFDDYIPPFATASLDDKLNGLNYASGAAGILEESGKHLGDRISLGRQLDNHKTTILRMNSLVGENRTMELLSKCIYTVGIGSNDYINNYFLPSFYPATMSKYTPDQYAEILIQQYHHQLMRLHTYGARKVGVFMLGSLGCIPFELKLNGINSSSCVETINMAAKLFNSRLVKLVDNINNNLLDANFIVIPEISNADSSEAETISGFKVVNKPCCAASRIDVRGHCVLNTDPCTNRNDYVYWDEFHPTEHGMQILASTAITALSPFYISPKDIFQPQHGVDSLASI